MPTLTDLYEGSAALEYSVFERDSGTRHRVAHCTSCVHRVKEKGSSSVGRVQSVSRVATGDYDDS